MNASPVPRNRISAVRDARLTLLAVRFLTDGLAERFFVVLDRLTFDAAPGVVFFADRFFRGLFTEFFFKVPFFEVDRCGDFVAR